MDAPRRRLCRGFRGSCLRDGAGKGKALPLRRNSDTISLWWSGCGGGERRIRHILIQPEITASDVEANDIRAESFAARLKAGETMADPELEPDTVDLALAQIARMSQALAAAMRNAQAGDVVGAGQGGRPPERKWLILARVLETTSGGLAEFFEFRDVIVERLQSQRHTERVVEGLRSKAYIDIRLGGG